MRQYRINITLVLRGIIILLIIPISSYAQIGTKVQQQLFGIWQNNQFGYEMTLMLNPDGTGEFDGESIKFSTRAAILSIIVAATTTDYSYNLQRNSLTLSGGDLDGQVTFTRSGSPSSQDPSIAKTPSNPISPSYSNTASNLLGIWSGNGEMIEFRSDGKCVYLGNTFTYQISQGHIILTTGQGNATFAYSVNKSQLTLTANGQNVVYNKVNGGSNLGTQKTTGAGDIPMELVGQWCYMNMSTNSQSSRCVVLNADGTYTFSSESSRSVNTDAFSGGTASQGADRGTWYAQGDRIYYNSQTTGQGSYKLEKRNHPKNVNDPMIVIDGESYVTMTSRPPWR